MADLQYSLKELPFTLEEIKKAVEKHPTPFHFYNEEKIRENAREFQTQYRKNFSDFKNYFAVKATPNPLILRFLKEEGMGVDCSSLAELILAEKGTYLWTRFFLGAILAHSCNSIFNNYILSRVQGRRYHVHLK